MTFGQEIPMRTSDLPPLDEVLYHKGSALLLDRVIEHTDLQTIAHIDAGKSRWLQARDGSIPTWLAIEYMAQCMAAHEGLFSYIHNREVHGGFLMSVSRLKIHVVEIPIEMSLHVCSRPLRGRPELGAISHTCSIFTEEGGIESAPLAEGRLSVSVEKVVPTTDSI